MCGNVCMCAMNKKRVLRMEKHLKIPLLDLLNLTWHQLQSGSDSLTGQMLGSPCKKYGVVSTLLQTSQLCLTHSPSTNLSTVSCVASGVEDGVASGVSQWRGRSPGKSD